MRGMSDFQKIMMQQTQQSVDAPVFCRYCGFNIKEPTVNSHGGSNGAWKINLDMELRAKCHVKCARENGIYI